MAANDPFSRRIHLALVHYPVYNKEGDVIASALTTIDIHDFARIARTYQLGKVWIVTPLKSQKELFHRMVRHWTEGLGATYNPNRKEALEVLSVAESIEEMTERIHRATGHPVRRVATSARSYPGSIALPDLAETIRGSSDTFALLFGTGWGLTESVIRECEGVLTPIRPYGYNHLSVRSAASIICDRLIGDG